MNVLGLVDYLVYRHPMSVLLTGAIIVALVLLIRRTATTAIHGQRAMRWSLLASAIIALLYALLSGLYCSSYSFFDHVEPNVIGISWMFATGKPVYHTLDAASRYSLLYGPTLFAIYGALLKATGASILALKLSVVAGLLMALGLAFFAYRKIAGPRIALVAVGYLLVALGAYADLPLWVRAESPLMVLTTASLLAALTLRPTAGAIAIGAAAGVALNIKAHAPLYFLPIWCLCTYRWRPTALLVAAAAAAVVAVAPFVIFPQVSFTNYLAWLRAAGKHGLLLGQLFRNVEMLVFLASPALALSAIAACRRPAALPAWMRLHATFLLALTGCAALVLVAASKPGAGPWHLMPFLVPLGYVVTHLIRLVEQGAISAEPSLRCSWSLVAAKSTLVGFCLASTVAMGLKVCTSWPVFASPRDREVAADLNRILNEHSGAHMMMGVGDNSNYNLSFYRPILLFRGQPYLLDFAAAMDMQLSHLPLPQSTRDEIAADRQAIWLVPRDSEPFTMKTVYDFVTPAFDPRFREMFRGAFHKSESTKYFDLWVHNESDH